MGKTSLKILINSKNIKIVLFDFIKKMVKSHEIAKINLTFSYKNVQYSTDKNYREVCKMDFGDLWTWPMKSKIEQEVTNEGLISQRLWKFSQ